MKEKRERKSKSFDENAQYSCVQALGGIQQFTVHGRGRGAIYLISEQRLHKGLVSHFEKDE